ncbi:gas vesicle accessory protein GvpU [Segnochrobactraceae bacterium EtOH-i3]
MTSDNTENQNEQIQIQPVEDIYSRDWFLIELIEDLASNNIEISITISIGGSIISGMLISGRKYFEEIALAVGSKSTQKGDICDVISSVWKSKTSIYSKSENSSEDFELGEINYIHLKDARFHAPGQSSMPSGKGVLWRGKISSIDGFFIGSFNVN